MGTDGPMIECPPKRGNSTAVEEMVENRVWTAANSIVAKIMTHNYVYVRETMFLEGDRYIQDMNSLLRSPMAMGFIKGEIREKKGVLEEIDRDINDGVDEYQQIQLLYGNRYPPDMAIMLSEAQSSLINSSRRISIYRIIIETGNLSDDQKKQHLDSLGYTLKDSIIKSMYIVERLQSNRTTKS